MEKTDFAVPQSLLFHLDGPVLPLTCISRCWAYWCFRKPWVVKLGMMMEKVLWRSWNVISTKTIPLLKYLRIDMVIKFAEEPELTNVEYFTPNHLDQAFSNLSTCFDWVRIIFFLLKKFFTDFKSDFVILFSINLRFIFICFSSIL